LTSVILSEVQGSLATEDESKDPENISLTMPRQGVLTKICAAPKGAFLVSTIIHLWLRIACGQ